MAKRGDYLKNASVEERKRIASSGGDARAKSLGKKRRLEISRIGSRVWSAQQKAKKQALREQ